MKFRIPTLLALCVSASQIFAQGGISPEMLQKIQQSYSSSDPTDRALTNALAGTPINTLALNWENQQGLDTHFTYQVNSKGITDQKSSGRCWLFSGLNVIRSRMIARFNLPEFTFSQSYCFFWDQLEKSNLFLQGIIDTRRKPMDDRMVDWLLKNPLGDGGQFTGVSDLIMKYGLVPSGVMPETVSANSTSVMSRLLKDKLREFALELREMPAKATAAQLESRKTEMLSDIYRMLALCLGEPVQEFEWTYYDAKGNSKGTRLYTPKSFYEEYVGQDLKADYVMLMNDPTHEFYQVYEIDFDRHVYDGCNWKYINLPIDEIKAIALASIKDSTAMYFSCDVNKQRDAARGYLDVDNYDYAALFGVDFPMDKKQRVSTFASGSSHAMTLMAVDVDENGQYRKWMVENSWGRDNGYKGHLIMTDRWFEEYMFRLVAERQYVPEKILKLLDGKPTLLPAWDPMFTPEE